MPDDHRRECYASVFYLLGQMLRVHVLTLSLSWGFLLAWVPLSSPLFKGFSGKPGRSVNLPRSHHPGVTAEMILGGHSAPGYPS